VSAVPQATGASRKVTPLTFREKKVQHQPISVLTAYDVATAQAVERAGLDAILVGDSLGMVVLGYETTLPVTMDEMLHHCRAVARGARRPLLIGDMPFLSYQVTVEDAVRNAGRFLQEGGMEAVKLEGGRERLPAVQAIVGAGIPVMGHLGLTPQSVHQLGGFRPQARTAEAARQLLQDALLLEQAGCFSLVIESVPARLAEYVSSRLSIPTIGIGAGAGCDGQVLVANDVLGLFERFTPRFAKAYASLFGEMVRAFETYRTEVEAGIFPGAEHGLEVDQAVWQAFTAGADELPEA
jgi:3-methyl-2-oxobutanoate hydroxymethyltransferase